MQRGSPKRRVINPEATGGNDARATKRGAPSRWTRSIRRRATTGRGVSRAGSPSAPARGRGAEVSVRVGATGNYANAEEEKKRRSHPSEASRVPRAFAATPRLERARRRNERFQKVHDASIPEVAEKRTLARDAPRRPRPRATPLKT